MLTKLKANIVTYLAISVIAFLAGIYAKETILRAKQVKDVQRVRVVDAAAFESVLTIEQKLQTKIDESSAIAQAVIGRVSQIPLIGKENVRVIYKTNELECSPDPHLSVGAIGLLNSARAGTLDHATAVGDAAGEASSVTRLSTFVVSDIELARAYNDLAARHDELVTYIEDLKAQQARRLRLK